MGYEDKEIIPYNEDYSKDNIPVAKYIGTKRITREVLFKLAKIGCTYGEIADIIGMPYKEFIDQRKINPDIDDAINAGRAELKANIRRGQLQVAMPDPENDYKGNAPMLIHLGKVVCGQNEIIEVKEDINVKLTWGNKEIYSNENKDKDEI
jgi:hypothetical protein